MQWRKVGRIFDPIEHRTWVRSHAQVPTVLVLSDRVRIFYADRTEANKSFMTWIDVDRVDPLRVVGARESSIMDFGVQGMFDDEGMMPGDTIRNADGSLWMYYTGWNQGVTIPYRNSIGLAVSLDDGNTFQRMFTGPVLDRIAREPLMAVTPFVLREDNLIRMWYVSGTQWVAIEGKLEPVYVIRYAESVDGISWERPGGIVVEQKHELEAHAHPSVLKIGDTYHMWFCYRDSRDYRDGSGAYRIGYAFSMDGYAWHRDDSACGLDVSPAGWDSSMTCYPYVTNFDGTTYMFYNGNSFGRTGIGYAVLER